MKKKGNKYWFCFSIVLCIIAMLGANFLQTSGYSVRVTDLRWETPSGKMMSALLFVPKNASADKPAPAIITSHGWFNNREMQDMNFIEYSRRGYVVMSIDMYGHGNSDVLNTSTLTNRGIGMTDAVELMASLPFVDKTRIGITGHSNGAWASNLAVDDDNKKDTPLISAVLLVANDANYKDKDGNYYNKYGNRDVAIVAAAYDEFFFRVKNDQGGYSAPKDYINQPTAQSFLNFGVDPAGAELRTAKQFYTSTINGKEAIRAIYTPVQIHPWNTISSKVSAFSLDFFEKALGAPNPIPSNQQAWQWKQAFNIIGLIGFCIFVWALAKVLLDTPYFATLKTKAEVAPYPKPEGKNNTWFWVSLTLGAVVSFVSYLYLPLLVNKPGFRPVFFSQSPVFFIGAWAVVNALFTAVLLLITWFAFGGKEISLKERGVCIGWKAFGKSVLFAASVVSISFLLVFISDYLFKVDFRFWVIPVKAFTVDKIGIILMYLPFFLLFYLIHSVAVNAFNYVKQGKAWVNVAVLAFFMVLGALAYVIIQYGVFFATGKSWTEVMKPSISNIYGIWLFPILVYFPLAVMLDRSLYKITKNPYLGGLIFGAIMTIMACTNTLTQLP
ncbi:MAG: hypothetical protein VB108_07485 [Anaerolineaceae bacterium]|nr:hypothetical protein [Anaerolineaceae bacterium]